MAWIAQAERDAGTSTDGGLSSDERAELVRLRRENRRPSEDVEILNEFAEADCGAGQAEDGLVDVGSSFGADA